MARDADANKVVTPLLRRPIVQFLLVASVLGIVATLTPRPWYVKDAAAYEASRPFINRDCADIECFRVLVSWVVDSLPGPSLLRWRTYNVLAEAGAAVAVGRLCLLLGLSAHAAVLATWISALGFGPLYATFDTYTSDPLMFLLGPLITCELLCGRRGRACALATIGIMAKEFAAAPLWIFTIWATLQRRWEVTVRVLLTAMTATLAWLTFHVTLMIFFNYSYGGSASADLMGGGDLAVWLAQTPRRAAIAAVLGEYGALYLLIPVGFVLARRDLRLLAVAAIPAVLALTYVQQPDRALWNFHFIAIPLAVLVLERLPHWAGELFVVCYGFANLRLGAQLRFIPAARFPLALSIVIAVAGIAVILVKGATQTARIAAETSS
jgi:hypothetical protein